jgi:peptide/nickel transport system permease protein
MEKGRPPWDSQFCRFVVDLAHGDFGESTERREPVIDVLKRGVGPSLSLTVPMLVGGTLAGLALALLCAAFRGGAADRAVLFGSTILMSVNYVVWVLAGQFVLAYKWRLFPIWGYENAFYLVLPVLIGMLSSLGVDVRFFRTAVLDEIYKPYVRTARAKGLSGPAILVKHVLRNSLIPIVTYVSLSIPYLFTGSLMLEECAFLVTSAGSSQPFFTDAEKLMPWPFAGICSLSSSSVQPVSCKAARMQSCIIYIIFIYFMTNDPLQGVCNGCM